MNREEVLSVLSVLSGKVPCCRCSAVKEQGYFLCVNCGLVFYCSQICGELDVDIHEYECPILAFRFRQEYATCIAGLRSGVRFEFLPRIPVIIDEVVPLSQERRLYLLNEFVDESLMEIYRQDNLHEIEADNVEHLIEWLDEQERRHRCMLEPHTMRRSS